MKVRFHGCTSFAGVDMSEIQEFEDTPTPEELYEIAEQLVHEWAGVESWYEVLEDGE